MITVVVADDEDAIRDLLVKKIADRNDRYRVAGAAGNGILALKLVQQYRPDLVITDICMPVMDGLELTEAVSSFDKNIKTLIISGYDDFSYAKKAISLGVKDYLLKPFLPEELFTVLDRIALEIEQEIEEGSRFFTGLKEKEKALTLRPREQEERLLIKVEMGDTEIALEILDEILSHYEDMVKQEYDNYVFIMLVELFLNISASVEKCTGKKMLDDRELLDQIKKYLSRDSLKEVKEILRECIRLGCGAIMDAGRNQGEKIVITLKGLIDKNISNEDFNIKTAAGIVYFSPSYIRQIFRRITGESFTEYLIRRRMEAAAKLLSNGNLKILDVAALTGYTNQRYFSECFKKYYHCTPTEYRKRTENA